LNSKSENHAFLLVSLQTNPLNLIATLGRTKYEMQNQCEYIWIILSDKLPYYEVIK